MDTLEERRHSTCMYELKKSKFILYDAVWPTHKVDVCDRLVHLKHQ